MIAYVDSSVLLRSLLKEEGRIRNFQEIKLGIASILIKIECLRALDRLKIENALTEDEFVEVRDLCFTTFRRMALIPLTDPVVECASQPWGIALRSLDSIHLASAILWRRSENTPLVFMTHDKRLAQAAKANNFSVVGV